MKIGYWSGLILSASLLLLSACGNLAPNDYGSIPAQPEPEYFGNKPISYGASPFQVKMTSQFKYRPTTLAGGLQDPTGSSVADISYAEFHVYNASGTMVQAGETDVNGEAVFDMPSTQGTYTFKIFSRAYNSKLRVSVLEDIYANQPYSVSKTFTLTSGILSGSSPYDAGTVTAEALESVSSRIEGGAFNIYYNILAANEFIRTQTANSAWVADKVSIYWKAGFNPYTYYNSTSPLSFYVPSERKLYILGGENGDVKVADTDHFDDSVILHEYGHFLEDAYGHSDSPGGSHNGNFIIDQRLAWSEGFGNFFQSAVLSVDDSVPSGITLRRRYYVDTYGHKGVGGNGGINILIDMNADPAGQYDNPGVDEGNFREMSVARTLYKATRSPAGTVGNGLNGGGVSFADFWTTFSGDSQTSPAATSLRNTTSYPTPSTGLFFELLKTNIGANANLDAILSEEQQRSDTQEYADLVTWTGSSCSRSIQGTAETSIPVPPGYFSPPRSNQLKNNDFLLFYHNGSSSNVLNLAYPSTNAGDGVTKMNLDLIVYKASYVYLEDYYYYSGYGSSYIAGQSRNENGFESACSFNAGLICEQVSLAGKSAGWYMVNVKVNAWGKNAQGQYTTKITNAVNGNVTYSIRNSGGASYLCP